MTATLLEITSSGKHKTLGVQGEGVSMSSMITIWLIVFVVLVIIEIITMGLTTIWFAGGALVATLAAAVHAPLWVQIVLFLVVSALLLFFTRPVAVKYFNKDRVRTNVESLIGQQAIVISEINNLQGNMAIGHVRYSTTGESKLENSQPFVTDFDEAAIPVGCVVIIERVSGVKLIVTPKQ